MSDVETSLTLTTLQTGLRASVATTFGTISGSSSLSANTGFNISEVEDKGLTYQVVSLSGEAEVEDPPFATIDALYTQSETIDELDLDLRWTDMPKGSELQIVSSTGNLNVNRRDVSRSGNFGISEKRACAGDTVLKIALWISDPQALNANSKVTMTLASIEGGGGGPVQKVPLEKLGMNLG